MGFIFRYRVTQVDSPTAPLEDTVVSVEIEPAHLDEHIRRLLRERINFSIHADYTEAIGLSPVNFDTLPINFWSEEPMDVCRGVVMDRQTGLIGAAGKYVEGKWVPNYLRVRGENPEDLVRALLADVERITEDFW